MAELEWLGAITGAASEAKDRLRNEKAKLKEANARADSIILSPKDILSGEWDAARTLETTIGGKQRAITNADLVAFSKNIKTVQAKHTLKGIKAQQVIDLSKSIDRERTSKIYQSGGKEIKPIRHASPVQASGDIVRFVTNAGGSTPGVNWHNVVVEFVQLSELASAATRGSKNISPTLFAKKITKTLINTPLKFYCDCGRHKFWFSYIATIGGFAVKPPYGMLQHGYPKITNPQLQGVACKHVIRVMHEILVSGQVQGYLSRHLEKMLLNQAKTAQTRQTQKDAEILAKSQKNRKDHAVLTSAEKKAAEADKKAERTKKAIAKAATQAPKPERKTPASKLVEKAPDPHSALRAILRSMGVENPTQEQLDAIRLASQK